MKAFVKSPCSSLLPFVERLWYFDHYFDQTYTTRVIPKINPFITICLHDLPNVLIEGQGVRQSAAWSINGLIDKSAAALELTGNMRMIGIELKPYSPYYLSGCQAEVFVNDHVCMSHFVPQQAMNRLMEEIDGCNDPRMVLECVEKMLSSLFKPYEMYAGKERMIAIIEQVGRYDSQDDTITRLARESAMSTRNFQRKFKAMVGISPKSWIEKIRLNRLIETLRSYDQVSLESCAYEHGFSDVSHMYKFFKKHKLVPPAQLRCDIESVDRTMLNYSF